MNKVYKHIWSETLGQPVVVSERAKGAKGKKKNTLASTLIAGTALLGAPAFADNPLPSGGEIVSGSGSIDQSGNAMTLTQSSQRMIANWQDFSIGADASVTFQQPGADAVALNRVIGSDPSQILGNLDANGQVFLINPNGVVFGQGAQVQTGGFVASTLEMADGDFLKGNYHFTGNGGEILNRGDLSGAVVALIAPTVINEGSITGDTALAAGTDVLLDFDGDGLISVEVKASTLETLVDNRGLIRADGGTAILTARGASDVLKGMVNNSGTVQARTLENRHGRILLLGDMENGTLNAAGSLEADFVETSAARVNLDADLQVDTRGGEWLIDPTDMIIDDASAIETGLAGGDVTVSTAGAGSDEGNIVINDGIDWSANVLTLNADNNISINAELNASATAGLALEYGQGAVAANNTSSYSINAPVNLAATGSFSTKLGSDGVTENYTIINTANALQNMNADLSGNYVLGADIDASDTLNWNAGDGFTPIGGNGDSEARYTGTFDGLGHTINDLTIDRPSGRYIGLFGVVGEEGVVRNLGLEGGSISANEFAGALAGANLGTLINSHASADVSGNIDGSGSYIGGLAGFSEAGSRLTNVYATGDVTGKIMVGGLVGYNLGAITNAYASGDVEGSIIVGGLVGQNDTGSISNAYASGQVTAAGIDGNAGGLVGINRDGDIDSTYATGAVDALQNVGGLIGQAPGNGNVTNSYWVAETTGQDSSAGGTRLDDIVNLTTALPNGFDTAAWGNRDDRTAPYLLGVAPVSTYIGFDTGLFTIVRTLDELQAVNHGLSGNYALWNHIDASDTVSWNGGAGFTPIGNNSTHFTGTFDGLGHIVTDLTINRPSEDYVGLFGYIGQDAKVRNIGLEGGSIAGRNYVGGLAGMNRSGRIDSAYTNINVEGSLRYVGGLLGYNFFGGQIANVYATGSVEGFDYVGGLVGMHQSSNSSIRSAFATGNVSISDSSSVNVGGLVGKSDQATVTHGYWVQETSGQDSSPGGGTGLTTIAQLTAALPEGFDTGLWGNQEGQVAPYLLQVVPGTTYVDGDREQFRVITTLAQLQALDDLSSSGKYALFNDIDAADSLDWNRGAGFAPIGGFDSENGPESFQGEFNGFGHSINDLVIHRPDTDLVGLFWTIGNGGRIRNLQLEGGRVVGNNMVGALAAANQGGVIANVSVSSDVIAQGDYVGGLVGANNNSGVISHSRASGKVATEGNQVGGLAGANLNNAVITDSHASGDVEGGNGTGGLVGVNADLGEITDSYATGNVSGGLTVGGLVGLNARAEIARAYATNNAEGDEHVGGLVGKNEDASITNVYATGDATGISNVGGLVGTNTDSGEIAYAYATGVVSGNDKIGGLVGGNDALILASFHRDAAQDNGFGTRVGDAEMQNPFTFIDAGWDLVNVWGKSSLGENGGHLMLRGAGADALYDDYVRLSATDLAKTYGDANPDLSGFTFADQEGAGTVTLNGWGSAITETTNAGNYAYSDNVLDISTDSEGGVYVDYGPGALTIDKRVISLTGGRTYDGGTDLDAAIFTLGNLANGESLVLSGTGGMADKNAGDGKAVTLGSLALGDDSGLAANYTLAGGTHRVDIAKAALSLLGVTAADKTYDGTTAATISNIGTLDGVINGDDIATDISAADATFLDKNAGTGKAVTVDGITLSGTDAGNYTLDATTATTADIHKAVLAVTASSDAKTYDGQAYTGGNGISYSGFVAGEDESDLSGTLAFGGTSQGAVNAGGYTIVASGLTSGNYDITYTDGTLTVDRAALTISTTDVRKTYDGTTTADGSVVVAGQLFGSDSLNGGSFAFADKNAGSGKTVTVSGVAIDDGNDGGNYAVTYVDNTSSTIDRATIAAVTGITALNKLYDGSGTADLDTSNAAFIGMVAGDELTVATAHGSFDDPAPGLDKDVSITGIVLDSADAGNYVLMDTTAAARANITDSRRSPLLPRQIAPPGIDETDKTGVEALADNRKLLTIPAETDSYIAECGLGDWLDCEY